MRDGRRLTGDELESAMRKVTLVLSVSGEGDQRVSILIHALAAVSANMQLEMASVINALTDSYLTYIETFENEFNDDDDYEEDDYD